MKCLKVKYHIFDRWRLLLAHRPKWVVSAAWDGNAVVVFPHTVVQAASIPHAANWGLLPALSLLSAFGLLLVSLADTGARAGVNWIEPIFWIGLLLLVGPIAIRLCSSEATRRERIGLVVLLGLGLYYVKVLHSPYAFTFSDELVHAYTTGKTIQNADIMPVNLLNPALARYPGLEIIVDALVSLSGLSIFTSGLIVIGAARLIFMLALFLFYESITGSARIGGIATAINIGAPNFLYWSSQFSYEPLALPLAVMMLYFLARRGSPLNASEYKRLTFIILLVITAIVITHHVTSYAVTAVLLAMSLLYTLIRHISKRKQPATWDLALYATALTTLWLFYIAPQTLSYLGIVFKLAAESVAKILGGQETTRVLFSGVVGYIPPIWDRAMSFGSVILLLLALPFGLLQVWRSHRANAMILLMAGGGALYFGAVALRLSDRAWEIGNRSSTYLFIGLALVIAIGIATFWIPMHASLWRRGLFAGCMFVVFAGGLISGWPPLLRLSQPYLVAAGEHVFMPQGIVVATWARAELGPGNRMAADTSNSLLMLTYGDQVFDLNTYPGRVLLLDPGMNSWQRSIVKDNRLKYVVVDRRLVSWEMRGINFDHEKQGHYLDSELLDPKVYTKYDSLDGVQRILDSGNIVVYDVSGLAASDSSFTQR